MLLKGWLSRGRAARDSGARAQGVQEPSTEKASRGLASRSTAFAAVGAAALLVGSVMVAQSSPRSELDVHLSDGGVWLPSTAIGGISLLDGGSGTIAASLGVAGPGDDFSVEQFGSDAVIINRTDGTVARLDGASWTIATGRVQFGLPGEPLDVVTGDDMGWMMTPGQAATIDMEALAVRAPVPVAAPFADGVITADGALLYSSSDPELPVQKFQTGNDPVPVGSLDGPTALIDLGPAIAAVDLDDRVVWLDTEGVVCSELEFPADAVLHAGGGESHLIVVSDQGGAFAWNPVASGCPSSANFINLGPGTYGDPALTDGWAVVPETSSGSVFVIDLEDMSVTDRLELEGVADGTEVSLIAEDGAIWYNDADSARAGLIRRDGTIIPIAKYEDGTTGFTSAPVDDAADDAEDVSIAGAQEAQQLEEQVPEAETVAGPELTTTTLAANNEASSDNGEDQSGTTSTTESTDNGEDTEDTTDTTETTTDSTDSTTDTTGEVIVEPPTETTNTSTTEVEPELDEVVISMGVSAQSVTVGDTINFTAIVERGNPNNFGTPTWSPAGPELLPAERIGSFRYLFSNPGRFRITITACEDATGECGSASTTVTIVADPDAIPLVAAIGGPTTVVAGESATFRDISQGEPDSWNWGTNNGNPSSGTNDTITTSWATPGPKVVTLNVTRGGVTRTATFDVDVVAAPVAAPFGLLCSPSTVDIGGTVNCQLDGANSDFSDISFSTSADGAAGFDRSTPALGRLTMTSSQERNVTVTLSATDEATGDAVSDTASVSWSAPVCPDVIPSVGVSGPATLEIGVSGNFTGSPADGCGTATRSWTASGGGSIANPSAASTSISWATAGTYTVTYNFGDGGGSSSDSMTVTVEDPPAGPSAPSVSISGASNLDTGASGSFSVDNSGGPIDSYSWSTNGGGGSGSGSTFSASWGTAGDYTVSLNVTGPGGSDTATYNVAVADEAIPPSPFGMSCDVASREVNKIFNCDFTTGNTGDFSNPQWTITPGNQYWLMNPWSYDAAGTTVGSTVTVTLTAVDLATGETVSASDSVTITPEVIDPAPMSINCSPGSVLVGSISTCSLTSGNEGSFNSPSWAITGNHGRWGGGFALDVAGNEPGFYTVTLSAIDNVTGQTVSATATFEATAPVVDPPPDDPPPDDPPPDDPPPDDPPPLDPPPLDPPPLDLGP